MASVTRLKRSFLTLTVQCCLKLTSLPSPQFSPLSIWKTLEPWTEWTSGMFVENLTCPAMDVFPPESDEGITTNCLLQKIIEVS